MTSPDTGFRDASLPGPGESWTPIRLTRWSGNYLLEKGIENGRLEAELILAQVLQVNRLDLYLQFDRPLRPPELEAFKALLLRRASREPLQYVLGRTAFRELELRSDARALIPRPETEILVGEVLAWAGLRETDLSGWDMGVGSGVIALSLLKEGPFRRFVGTDPSREALDLAKENAEEQKLADRLELREGGAFRSPVGGGAVRRHRVQSPLYP